MKELLNTLKPLSLSFSEEQKSEFVMLSKSINNYFKINCIEFYDDIELKEYVLPSLRYINKHLMLFESEDILDKIDKFVDLIEHMNEAIIEKHVKVICKDLNFEEDSFDLIYFAYLWSNLTSCMLCNLKHNYGWVEKKPSVSIQGDCCCNCGCNCNNCTCTCTNPNYNACRPIQESYYSKWDEDESYLERY